METTVNKAEPVAPSCAGGEAVPPILTSSRPENPPGTWGKTGVFNLSENEVSVLLHFEDGQTQQWTMARLDEPKGSEQGQ